MSVYLARRKDGSLKSPYYQFDFIIKVEGECRRFHGSTKERDKKAARDWERGEKERLKGKRPNDDMTMAQACNRYEDEVSDHQPSADDTSVAFEHCCRLIGGDRKLINVKADDIANAARKRAAETYGKNKPKVVSGATVNRQIVEPMRRLIRRAKQVWGMSCDPDLIKWRDLKRKEPTERVREFTADEADAFWKHLRRDYFPLVWFLANRGFRVRATIAICRSDVDMGARRVKVHQKGKGDVWMPLSQEQAIVLAQELNRCGKAPSAPVWTYEGLRKDKRGAEKGSAAHAARHPITYDGLRRVFGNALKTAGITGFRIHDLRHDFASKLLRATRDLALVRKAMGHSDIASTARYAHVLDEDVAAGMEAMSKGLATMKERNRA